MEKVRVTAAQGVTLRGPMKLKLTKDQLSRRPSLKAKRGVVALDGGEGITLKYGEEFEVDGLGKIGRDRVEKVGSDEPADPSGGGSDPGSGGSAGESGSGGDDETGGGDGEDGDGTGDGDSTGSGSGDGDGANAN